MKAKGGTIFHSGAGDSEHHPLNTINHKISTIPEDRHKHGLVLDFTVAENMVLENYHKAPFPKGVLQLGAINKFR